MLSFHKDIYGIIWDFIAINILKSNLPQYLSVILKLSAVNKVRNI